MSMRDLIYGAYERHLQNGLNPDQLPKHVGAIVDGNRRWAKGAHAEVTDGYQAGADKIVEFLGWCDDLGVEVVTLWLLSTDNLRRPADEVAALLGVIEELIVALTGQRRWPLRLIGNLDLLPDDTAARLKVAADSTGDIDAMTVNICIGYGGRQELTEAMRSLLVEQAEIGRAHV